MATVAVAMLIGLTLGDSPGKLHAHFQVLVMDPAILPAGSPSRSVTIQVDNVDKDATPSQAGVSTALKQRLTDAGYVIAPGDSVRCFTTF